MMKIERSQLAKSDLIGIWLYSFERWGKNRANQYLSSCESAIQTIAQNPNIESMRFSRLMKHTSMVINGAGATNPLKRSLSLQSCLFLGRCFWHKHYLSFQLHTDLFFFHSITCGVIICWAWLLSFVFTYRMWRSGEPWEVI